MSRKPEQYFYTVQGLAELTGWEPNRIYQDAHRQDLELANIADAATWLAANGPPDLRASMAAKLLPAVFGIELRDAAEKQAFLDLTGDLWSILFEQDQARRRQRGKRISKSRLKVKR